MALNYDIEDLDEKYTSELRSKVEDEGVVSEEPQTIKDLIYYDFTAEQIEKDKNSIDFDEAFDEAKQQEENERLAEIDQ